MEWNFGIYHSNLTSNKLNEIGSCLWLIGIRMESCKKIKICIYQEVAIVSCDDDNCGIVGRVG